MKFAVALMVSHAHGNDLIVLFLGFCDLVDWISVMAVAEFGVVIGNCDENCSS